MFLQTHFLGWVVLEGKNPFYSRITQGWFTYLYVCDSFWGAGDGSQINPGIVSQVG